MNKVNFLRLWSLASGAMDTVTGLLLIVAPAFVLQMLRISPPAADAWVFLRWIGVFVMAVGMSYGLAVFGKRAQGEVVWIFTALVRMMVAVFVLVQVAAAAMPPAWLGVAASDGAVALVQIIVLRRGWWKEVAA